MTSAGPSQSDLLAKTAPRSSGGLKEWFWRSQALTEAKASPRPSSLRRERSRRARLAAELADRAVDPADPLRAGSSLPLALSLYREAAFWALLAHTDLEGISDLRGAFAAVEFTVPALGAEELAMVRSALVDKTFVDSAEERTEIVCRQVDLAQAFVHALIHDELDERDKVAGVLVQRWLRLGAVLVVVFAGLYAVSNSVSHALQGPDLALGKAWRASSRAYECHPKDMECGGARSAMFFHTNEENSPWVEIDLGSSQTFARIEIVNREDCCLERAVPLVVEVGDDQSHFHEVARHLESFRDWETTITPVKARYVRLRVDRRSVLHLVRVTVRAR
jgi:hypothetical protein